jgi:hypothetical protein
MKLAVLVWVFLLAGLLAAPHLAPSPDPGDALVRNTVRLALLYYALAASLMLLLRRDDWAAVSARGRLARGCWTLAWAAYVIHVGVAFHYAHHWSHAEAVEATRRRSGVGEGIYVSHLFTLLWTADVLWWWLWSRGYAARNAWVDRVLHGFMVFVIFNATVVFEGGLVRWAGAVLLAALAGVWLSGRARRARASCDARGDRLS